MDCGSLILMFDSLIGQLEFLGPGTHRNGIERYKSLQEGSLRGSNELLTRFESTDSLQISLFVGNCTLRAVRRRLHPPPESETNRFDARKPPGTGRFFVDRRVLAIRSIDKRGVEAPQTLAKHEMFPAPSCRILERRVDQMWSERRPVIPTILS